MATIPIAIELPEIEPLAMEFDPDAIMFLIYGPPGTYKTPAIATWPKPIIYIDTDNGMLSIVSIYNDISGIYRIKISDVSTRPTGYAGPIGWLSVRAILKTIMETGCYPHGGEKIFPKTIVLDTLSTASRYAMRHTQFALRHVGQVPIQQDWNYLSTELNSAIDDGLACRCHFILVAHEELRKEEATGRMWLVPLVTGKLAFHLDNRFSEVYHTKATPDGSGTKFEFETRPTPLMRARSRIGVPQLIQANFSAVQARINELTLKVSQQQTKGGSIPTQPAPTPTPPVGFSKP